MGESKATVNLRLGRILRREEVVEFFLRIDDPGVRIAESEGAIVKVLLDGIEQVGSMPNELRHSAGMTWAPICRDQRSRLREGRRDG